MQFTSDEKKMIDWLRKQHQGWPTTRVIILSGSVLCAGFAAWELFGTGWAAMPLLLICIAAYGSSYTLGSWSGRPEISLLLKLIDSQKTGPRA